MKKKIYKKFFVTKIIASELVSLNCLYLEMHTFHREPMCWWAIPRFCMSIREIFPTQLTWQWSINMVKVLWRRFQKGLGRSSFRSNYLKFNLDFKNAVKNGEKVFSFWSNCIWIGIVKLSLLRTEYLPWASNVLRSSAKI